MTSCGKLHGDNCNPLFSVVRASKNFCRRCISMRCSRTNQPWDRASSRISVFCACAAVFSGGAPVRYSKASFQSRISPAPGDRGSNLLASSRRRSPDKNRKSDRYSHPICADINSSKDHFSAIRVSPHRNRFTAVIVCARFFEVCSVFRVRVRQMLPVSPAPANPVSAGRKTLPASFLYSHPHLYKTKRERGNFIASLPLLCVALSAHRAAIRS